jgi:hypothetical protein
MIKGRLTFRFSLLGQAREVERPPERNLSALIRATRPSVMARLEADLRTCQAGGAA